MSIQIQFEHPDGRPIAAKFQHSISLVSVVALAVFMSACATQSQVARTSNIQAVLVQAGFKSKLATTAQQQRRLGSLPEHEFTRVQQNGGTFYVWADKPNNRLYCGSEQGYRNYKEIRQAQYDRESGAFTWIAEPTNVPITVFYGWAPFGQW